MSGGNPPQVINSPSNKREDDYSVENFTKTYGNPVHGWDQPWCQRPPPPHKCRRDKDEKSPDDTIIRPIKIKGQKGEKEEGTLLEAHATAPGKSKYPAINACCKCGPSPKLKYHALRLLQGKPEVCDMPMHGEMRQHGTPYQTPRAKVEPGSEQWTEEGREGTRAMWKTEGRGETDASRGDGTGTEHDTSPTFRIYTNKEESRSQKYPLLETLYGEERRGVCWDKPLPKRTSISRRYIGTGCIQMMATTPIGVSWKTGYGRWWHELAVLSFCCYDTSSGKVWRHFAKALNEELLGVKDRRWNSKRFIILQRVILQ